MSLFKHPLSVGNDSIQIVSLASYITIVVRVSIHGSKNTVTRQSILSMLEDIRCKLMKMHVKKELINSMEEALGPKIKKKLGQKKRDEASNCWYTYAGRGMFEVECIEKKFIVDVDGRTCGCRKWDITGIPCSYAIFAIWYFFNHKKEKGISCLWYFFNHKKFSFSMRLGWVRM